MSGVSGAGSRRRQKARMYSERAASSFAELAQRLNALGFASRRVAHFVNKLIFCMFAEDISLLEVLRDRGQK